MIDPAAPDYSDTPVSPRRPLFDYCSANVSAAPLVTIVTPFYNTGEVFHETARSILQQSCQQWEWVIVNDGSTDPTSLSVLEAYREHDPRIVVIDHPENRGPGAARNTGFGAARAPYVVQLDSDDLLEPTALEKWWWFLESNHEYSFVKGWTVGFGEQRYLWEKGFHDGKASLDENLLDVTGMVRKAVHEAVGGYDETNRDGLEDWEFWLRCASFGYWGGTVPEYLDWYRRRRSHNDRWGTWDNGKRQRRFEQELRSRYQALWDGAFPTIRPGWHEPNETVPDGLPGENALGKKKLRLLLIAPWLALGGAEKFYIDLLHGLTQYRWEVSIATTLKGDYRWLPQFSRYTPDVFILPNFLRRSDYPRFLRYLIQSRQIDVVLVTNSEFGYMVLPYLRAHFPGVAYVDFCHMEEEYWKNGGHPRSAVEYQELLDLNIVASCHLKEWMTRQGAKPERIEVCYINVDTERWRPAPDRRVAIRRELGLTDQDPVVLYAGRVCSQKQPTVFARTILTLARNGERFVALVAGDGPGLDWLRWFVQKHKLGGRVRILGAISNERMREVMASADVFFLPSRWEGIAATIYEAMACGVPVVAADVGGQRELVTPECGALVERGDEATEVRRYTEALSRLLGDARLRATMGERGWVRVREQFDMKRMVERAIQLLEQARRLARSAPRPSPSLGLGRVCAFQAVEYARVAEVADELWGRRERRSGVLIYALAKRWLGGWLRLAAGRGWMWPHVARRKVKRWLVR